MGIYYKYIIVSNHNHEILRNCCSLRRRGGLRWHPTSRRSRPPYIPATREDYDNGKELWGADWAKYRAAHPNDQDCGISESDNWKGAQQCSQSWECRGARLCERGGWCSGY